MVATKVYTSPCDHDLWLGTLLFTTFLELSYLYCELTSIYISIVIAIAIASAIAIAIAMVYEMFSFFLLFF